MSPTTGGGIARLNDTAHVYTASSVLCLACSGCAGPATSFFACGVGAKGVSRTSFLGSVPRGLGASAVCVLRMGSGGNSFCVNASRCAAGNAVCHFGGSNAFVRRFSTKNVGPGSTVFFGWCR